MREALRRILWIVPTLILISIVAFWAISSALDAGGRARPEVHLGPHLPRFFNSSPVDVSTLTADAMQQIANSGSGAERARSKLAELGGAALPYVLPSLDGLPPDGRGRVALALGPIGRRMGVGSPEELDNPDTAVIFWTRFWQDRALDFRPTVVKRLVRRLTQRGLELRRDDIIELDTYALPELIDAMPKVQRAAEVRAAERLTTIASHVTGKNWRISPNSTPAQADLVVRRWRDWWAVHRPEYVRLDGPRRVIATVTETRYGRWVGEAVRHRFGRTAHGQPVLDVFRERLPTTLWLIAFALLGGCAGGIVLGTAAARSGRSFDLITSLVTVAVAAVPAAAVAAWFGPKSPSSGWLAALTMLVMGVALLSRHQRAVALRRGRIQLEARYASGGDRWRGAAALARQASTGLISLLGTELPVVLTSAFLFEKAFGLRGLGSVTFDALHSGDVTWLMALALSGAASVALMQIASDALLQAVDPKIQLSLLAKRETVP